MAQAVAHGGGHVTSTGTSNRKLMMWIFLGSECLFFGAASWLMGPLARVIGETRAAAWSDTIDRMIGVRRSAFKFVLYARARG